MNYVYVIAYVKDDTATLSSSGIHSGSLVLLFGDTANVSKTHHLRSNNIPSYHILYT
jgi:hypothetical protein